MPTLGRECRFAGALPLDGRPYSEPLRMRTSDPKQSLALRQEVEHWSLTTLLDKLIKIGAKVVRHGRYVTFQLADVAVPRKPFRKILSRIDDLRPRPTPA